MFLFILCTISFQTHTTNPRYLSFIDDIKNFEKYLWRIDVYKELSVIDDIKNFEKYLWSIDVYKKILRELNICKGSTTAISESKEEEAVKAEGSLTGILSMWEGVL